MVYYDPLEVLKRGRRVESSFLREKPSVKGGQRLVGLIEKRGYHFSPDLTDYKDFSHYLGCYNMNYYFDMRFYILDSDGFKKSKSPIKVSSKDITKLLNKKKDG